MDNPKPPERAELVTVNVVPVQVFVAEAIPLPPGTPARPRPDRPPFVSAAPVQTVSSQVKPASSSDPASET